jgi:SAM-dependent methyltransferase
MADDIARYNQARWAALAAANAVFTRPVWDLTPARAQALIDPDRRLGNLSGRTVLCLAGGGGQQGPAFALLGAQVTVADLSAAQLARDQAAAAHYGVSIVTVEADMRDLHLLPAAHFDLVWQPYSLNFVPDVRAVFAEVARVIRPGGTYYLHCANPFTLGLTPTDWAGDGYRLAAPYVDGALVSSRDLDWVYDQGSQPAVPGPREYRHTLSTLVNSLIAAGFTITHLDDSVDLPADPTAPPGSWEHFTAVAPPWFALTAISRTGPTG